MAAPQQPPQPLQSTGLDTRLRDAGFFIREAVRTFRATGALAPSSRALGNGLARFVDERENPGAPLSIMEAGAGTGAVSRVIAQHMQKSDTLDLVESNAEFAGRLAELLAADPELSRVADCATVHQALVTDLGPDRSYDVIVSGLPFANFTAEEVREILDYYFSVLRPGGHLSMFGYLYTKQAKAVLAPRADYLRQARSSWVVEEWVQRYGIGTERVMANLPPAWIHHLQKPAEG